MENASKALLIAAGVLIAIILATFGIKVVSSSKGAIEQGEEIGGTISSTSKGAIDKLSGVLGIQGQTSNGSLGIQGEASHDAFIWKSNDPNSPDYGVVIGYKEKAQNYPILRFPKRCTQINFEYYSDRYAEAGITGRNGRDDSLKVSRAFTNNIIKVEIPSTVKVIGDQAFGISLYNSFSKLKEVEIEGELTTIGIGAFEFCKELISINIPEGITDINDRTFFNCISLESITIPNNVENIGLQAFSGCTSLKKVKIMSKSLFTVESLAFMNIAENSIIYVLSKDVKQAFNPSYGNGRNYDISITEVYEVTEEDMKNI